MPDPNDLLDPCAECFEYPAEPGGDLCCYCLSPGVYRPEELGDPSLTLVSSHALDADDDLYDWTETDGFF